MSTSPESTVAAPEASSDARSVEAIARQLDRPLLELVFDAATVHRQHHAPSTVQCSQLLSIKTGGCPEDCGYCSQSARHGSELEASPLMKVGEVAAAAKRAREGGADRFCLGAAWREVKDGPQFDQVLDMVRAVKSEGLESCVTLGMLTDAQAKKLKDAGLDYYNHNLDTGRSHYDQVISTRTYDDRLKTLDAVRDAGMKTCCGGILGMGEGRAVRAEFLAELAAMSPPPESVPINCLVPVDGTPMAETEPLDWNEVVRTVAAARIAMPTSVVRLSAGRLEMHEAVQAMCFLAGANSIFVGDTLLTTPNPEPDGDAALFAKLGLKPMQSAPTECSTPGG